MDKPESKSLLNINLILDKAQISDSMLVADLGCGATGHFVFSMAPIVGRTGKVYAVDVISNILEAIAHRARQDNINNIKIVWSNLELPNATKIDSSSLDAALLINTLYQSRKRLEILTEAARILKKDGRLLIAEWKNVSLPFGPPKEERVRKDNLKQLAAKAGLRLEDEFTAGPYHYGAIYIKI